MGVVLDPEAYALAVLWEEGLLAGAEPQQGTQPGLTAADDLEHPLADAVVAGSRCQGEVFLKLRLESGKVAAEGALVDGGVHGFLLRSGPFTGPVHSMQDNAAIVTASPSTGGLRGRRRARLRHAAGPPDTTKPIQWGNI